MAHGHKILPQFLIMALEKSQEFEDISQLGQWLDENLPYPSPVSRKKAVDYILRILELKGKGREIKRHPLARLQGYLTDDKTKRELAYWQVIKNFPYLSDFASFLSENIERGKVSRQEAKDFLYSLMHKQSKDTFDSLLFLLDKFGFIIRDRKYISLKFYTPSSIAFSFALCEDMLRERKITIDLGEISKERVPRVFFMNNQRVLSVLENENKLWQIERRPPHNRILLLVSSLDDVVNILIRRLNHSER